MLHIRLIAAMARFGLRVRVLCIDPFGLLPAGVFRISGSVSGIADSLPHSHRTIAGCMIDRGRILRY